MECKRLFDKSIVPTEQTIASLLAQVYPVWEEIFTYILSAGKILVETKYFTKKYGWSRRFYKGSKTICYLFPEAESFSMLIVFGQKEIESIEHSKNQLSDSIYNTITQTEHFHDGRWVWLQITDDSDITSVKKLIDIRTHKKESLHSLQVHRGA